MKKKMIYFSLLILFIFLISTAYYSYAFFTHQIEEHGKLNLVVGTLDYQLESSDLVNHQVIIPASTTKEIVITVTSLNTIGSEYELFYEIENNSAQFDIGYTSNTTDLPTGEIEASGKKKITIYIRNYSNQDQTITFGVEGGFQNHDLALKKGYHISEISYYAENILNGANPELTDHLIPVKLADDGTVKKANLYDIWYQYENKRWANAVVLKDENKKYENDEVIPESDIESYFVWIPKYKYQLFNIEEYSNLTSFTTDKPPTIEIQFGITNTSDKIVGECLTPRIAGSIGSCQKGNYMTHPAFLAFGGNGFWVGKFETGYEGAKQTTEAQINEAKSDKIIIKPNVYSWRNISIGNAFQASYEYLRNEESHMMKNTEWGAVAYLQHSKYGSHESVRINNNKSLITGYAGTEEPTLGYNNGEDMPENHVEGTELNKNGTNTKMYNTIEGYHASTTGNITGVYDMSGGAWEYVMGYTINATYFGGNSEITNNYPEFFNDEKWKKYYDNYTTTISLQYNNRILGDATGEMGPFGQEEDPDKYLRSKSSWYKDYADFIFSSLPWFFRGGLWYDGVMTGVFAFGHYLGGADPIVSFRIVLIP